MYIILYLKFNFLKFLFYYYIWITFFCDLYIWSGAPGLRPQLVLRLRTVGQTRLSCCSLSPSSGRWTSNLFDHSDFIYSVVILSMPGDFLCAGVPGLTLHPDLSPPPRTAGHLLAVSSAPGSTVLFLNCPFKFPNLSSEIYLPRSTLRGVTRDVVARPTARSTTSALRDD